MRVAIFGGTFDPIHEAHLAIAGKAADRFALDRVLFVPASQPPHKLHFPRASYEDRLRMVQLACESDPRFEASSAEAGGERSYSIHTIETIRSQLSAADELFFLIGGDAFADIRSWRRWRDVGRLVTFIVVSRPGYSYEVPDGIGALTLPDVELPVSSSEIRKQIAEGVSPRQLPPKVRDYIASRRLYAATA